MTRPLFTPSQNLAGTLSLAGPRPLAVLAAEFVRAGGGRVRMPAPAPWSPAALDPGLCPDSGVIGAVAREPYLTVRYDRRFVDPVWLAVQIPLAFAAKSVAVVGKTVGQVNAFAALARDAGLDAAGFDQLRRYKARNPDGDTSRGILAAAKQVGGDSATPAWADTNDNITPAEPIVAAWLRPSTAPQQPPARRGTPARRTWPWRLART